MKMNEDIFEKSPRPLESELNSPSKARIITDPEITHNKDSKVKKSKTKKQKAEREMVIPPVKDLSLDDEDLEKKKTKRVLVSKSIVLEAYQSGVPLKQYLKKLEKTKT